MGASGRRQVRWKKDRLPVEAALDPEVAAKQAQLRYVDDSAPGITRRKARNGFDYHLPDGALVRDIDTLKRIRSLYGSVPTRTATCRRPGAMPAVANSTAIIRVGARSATK